MQPHLVDAGHFYTEPAAECPAGRASAASQFRSLAARLSPAHLSLDSWAVALALAAALLVRTGVVSHIPW